MASEIFMSMGSTTDSILNGPSRRSASIKRESDNTKVIKICLKSEFSMKNLVESNRYMHSILYQFQHDMLDSLSLRSDSNYCKVLYQEVLDSEDSKPSW